MNHVRVIAVCLILIMSSCDQKNPEDSKTTPIKASDTVVTVEKRERAMDIPTAVQAVRNELQKRSVQSQLFSSDSLNGQIVGKGGTVIDVDKSALETVSGKPVTGDVIVELKELLDKSAFITAEAPTVSDGKLLVSGGAYFIGMKCNGEELKLRPGRKLNIHLPKAGDGMSLFYGQRDGNGVVNWKPANKELTRTPQTDVTTGFRASDGKNYWLANCQVRGH